MKKFYPVLINMREVTNCDVREERDGKWVPARPLGCPTFLTRIKLAWNVFIGNYDAVEWS